MSFFCRRVCCCCYSDAKQQTNPVTLTRAETITVQPTTSAALELHRIDGEAYAHEGNQNGNPAVMESPAPNPTGKRGAKKSEDLDEIDLNDGVPTDEDLQQVVPSQTDNAFAAAVTDMMLDEIHEEDSEKHTIVEEPLKIDNDAVIEATDDEVRNTLTRKTVTKSEAISQLIEEEKNIAPSDDDERTIGSPTKPPRVNLVLDEVQKAESENDDDFEDYNPISKEIKISEIEETPKLNLKSADYAPFKDREAPASDSDSIKSLQDSREDKIEEEFSDDDLPLPPVQQDLRPEPQPKPDAIPVPSADDADDETTVSTDLSSVEPSKAHQELNVPEQHERPSSVPPPLPTSSPPHDITPEGRPALTMYGALSSDESDESESESESESISNPPRKPNRVSVKQSNVVVTKVTAVDAPSESDVDSKSETQKKTIVVSDEDNSERQV